MLDHVDIPRLDALNKYWADHPPVQWMVAAYFGIKPKQPANNEGDIAQLLAMFPATPK